MKTKLWLGLSSLVVLFSISAHGQFITVDADLMVKPDPTWSQSQARIDITPTAKLPDMHFDLPYRADWTNVQASLMSGLNIKTENIGNNEALVEMTWNQPGVLIYDLVLADGKCFCVNWKMPQGGWRVQGRIVYDSATNSISWGDFAFFNETVGTAAVNLGDCSITPERMERLARDLERQSVDPTWMQPLIRRALLEWTQVKKSTGYAGLLDTITYPLTDCVSLTWKPDGITPLPSGMWRIPGKFILSSTTMNLNFGTVTRTESDAAINSIKENTIVLPLNALEQITAATARNRGFHGHVPSGEILAFANLFKNYKIQRMEWPDLMKFQPESPFLFHVSVYGPVTLSDRKPAVKGLSFAHKSAMAVTTKAWINESWFPYFDFRSVETGRVQTWVDKGSAYLHLNFDELHLRSYLRDEFAQVRPAEEFTNPALLNARFSKLFQLHDFSFPLPKWQVGNGFTMTAASLAASTKSLRLPLTIAPINPLPYGAGLRIVDRP